MLNLYNQSSSQTLQWTPSSSNPKSWNDNLLNQEHSQDNWTTNWSKVIRTFPNNRNKAGHGRRKGGQGPPRIFKLLAKKGCFSISRGKNQISPFWPPLEKNLGKSPAAPPPGKHSSSDAHEAGQKNQEKKWQSTCKTTPSKSNSSLLADFAHTAILIAIEMFT